MAKRKKITEVVDISPYNCQMWVTNDIDHAQETIKNHYKLQSVDFSALMDALKGISLAGYVTEVSFDGREDSGVFLVCFTVKPDAEIISHEAIHVKNHVFNRTMMDVNATRVCDEHEAYLVGFLVKEMWRIMYAKKDKGIRSGETEDSEGEE